MIVGDLDRVELTSRLSSEQGLSLQTGPFSTCIRSRWPQIADGISLLYPDFSLASDDLPADFTVNIAGTAGLRRWILPRACYFLRGDQSPVFGWFPPRLAVPFLEWGMNYAIYGQLLSSLILHAAVLERNGRALIIMGDSGAGKSTLCAALTLSGWRLLTDELGLVDLEDGMIVPLARPVGLKNESINVIRGFFPEAKLGPICLTRRKGAVAHLRPPTESVRRIGDRAKPGWLVFVRYSPDAPLNCEEIPRAQAFPGLSRGTFNYYGLGETGFHVLCRLLDQVVCQRLEYGRLEDVIAHFHLPPYGRGLCQEKQV